MFADLLETVSKTQPVNKGLGEMQTGRGMLETLNKVLSNTKTRDYGELQLGQILKIS